MILDGGSASSASSPVEHRDLIGLLRGVESLLYRSLRHGFLRTEAEVMLHDIAGALSAAALSSTGALWEARKIASASMLVSYCQHKALVEQKGQWQVAFELLEQAFAVSAIETIPLPEDDRGVHAAALRLGTSIDGDKSDCAEDIRALIRAARSSGNPLLFNVLSMHQHKGDDWEWAAQWRELLATIDQHLTRVGYKPGESSAPTDGTATP